MRRKPPNLLGYKDFKVDKVLTKAIRALTRKCSGCPDVCSECPTNRIARSLVADAKIQTHKRLIGSE